MGPMAAARRHQLLLQPPDEIREHAPVASSAAAAAAAAAPPPRKRARISSQASDAGTELSQQSSGLRQRGGLSQPKLCACSKCTANGSNGRKLQRSAWHEHHKAELEKKAREGETQAIAAHLSTLVFVAHCSFVLLSVTQRRPLLFVCRQLPRPQRHPP